MLSKPCKLHLEEVGETGFQHMKKALKTAVKLQLLVPVLIIHSVAPRFFTKTATNVLKDILEERNE
mgnify:CR=1 FL=1|tara:strand:- start:2075 stop:2272 length:198 start_codon:yes stop_codon:yes gene_type:complete